MAQAATLTQQQLQRVLDYLRTRRHYKRNRTIILLTHYAMLRVGEVAALRYCDVLEADGQIKAETTLTAAQTKGKKGRKIWFAEKVRVELAAYVAALNRPGFRGGGLVKVLRFPEPQTVFACRSSVQLQLVEYSRLSLTGVCC